MSKFIPIRFVHALFVAVPLLFSPPARARELLQDDVFEPFRPADAWHGVAEVAAVPGKTEVTTAGEGRILVNGTTKDTSIPYLFTKADHGDVRVELEFMIPKNSNAGVYLAGRYEVQILDSHGKPKVGSSDLGGIYQCFDPALPKGRQASGGIAPKLNAAKPPGEWQTLDITFLAPRFDADGKKTRDATFEKVLVNGVLVQENATTPGPTQSAPLPGDAAQGPIAIQGDHGPIAIRSFRVTPLDDGNPARVAELDAYWAEVSRAVTAGDFDAYQASCHPEGVLVSGSKRMSQPLGETLARWKKDFDETRSGKVPASVEFRFSKRVGDATTAHETGVFRYTAHLPGELPRIEYIDFEALLVKRADGWKILMENQKGPATKEKWKALE